MSQRGGEAVYQAPGRGPAGDVGPAAGGGDGADPAVEGVGATVARGRDRGSSGRSGWSRGGSDCSQTWRAVRNAGRGPAGGRGRVTVSQLSNHHIPLPTAHTIRSLAESEAWYSDPLAED